MGATKGFPWSKRGSFGRWDSRVSQKSVVLPLLSLGVLVPLIIVGLWWFTESQRGDARDDRGGSDESDRNSLFHGNETMGSSGVSGVSAAVRPDTGRSGEIGGSSRTERPASSVASVEEMLAAAEESLLEGELEAAQHRLDSVLRHPEFGSPFRARYENVRGSVEQRKGNSEAAVSHFLSARQAAPGDVAVALNLAEALRSSGMARLTEAALLDALELSPDGFLPNVRYRFFLIQTGRGQQVVEEVQNLPEEERMGVDVLAVVAGLHASAGSYDKVDRVVQRIRSETDEGTVSVLLSDPVFQKYVAARISDSAVAGVAVAR